MIEKNDFIQLPPIKKDTPSEVVSMIWQYLKLPEESRKRVTADLIDVDENCDAHLAESLFQTRSSSVATWVYVQKYVKHKTLDEMLQEWKGASQFIIVMDTWFERLMAE